MYRTEVEGKTKHILYDRNRYTMCMFPKLQFQHSIIVSRTHAKTTEVSYSLTIIKHRFLPPQFIGMGIYIVTCTPEE
jgi:hypothetical protein